MSFTSTATAVCSCKWCHRLRWSKCPFQVLCLSPNDCCKLNSARFGALMGANRKLRMVIVQIICTLLLPPFYGPSSALKTNVLLSSMVRLHINGSISPWRIFPTRQNIWRMARTLCILVLLCFASCCAENSKTEHHLKDLQVEEDVLTWLKSQEKWVRYFIV